MATFQVSHSAPSGPQAYDADAQNSASTSYLYLSGHTTPSQKRAASRFARVEEDEDANGDARMLEGMDEYDGGEGDQADGAGAARLATTGQAIASFMPYMRGHGAYVSSAGASAAVDGEQERASGSSEAALIRSSLCGVVRRTNKLISVTSLKTRYAPEVGDLVIGRITDLQPGNRRWKVDIQSRQEANLLLSSINLPGGIQRRKLESDELEMRTFFKEGDLLVCEVQSIFHDGSTSLHTRSLNYGKLRNGQLALVNPCLVRRLKSHFVRLEHIGLDILIGLNGVLWVAMLNTGKVNVTTGTGRDIEAIYSDINDAVPMDVRQRISRMLNVIGLLAQHQLPISDVTLTHAYDAAADLVPLPNDNEEGGTAPPIDSDDVSFAHELSSDACSAVLDHVRSMLRE